MIGRGKYAGRIALVVFALLLATTNRGCLDPCANCASSVVVGGPGSFELTGSLHEDRSFAAAQAVPGNANEVLVAGGGRFAGYPTRAQVFRPLSSGHTITNDAELTDPRANHTATLLKDGTVLVAGGDNGAVALQSAEIYVPSTTAGEPGTFKSTGTMFSPRTHHTATLLNNGEVLITGGSPGLEQLNSSGTEPVPNGANNSAELYDPASGAFLGARQAMTVARTEHTATLMKNGQVLLVGGIDDTGAVLATAEIYDPSSQTFTPTTGNLNFARYDHQATLIECGKGCQLDGDVLITGGFDATFATDGETQFAELFDPTTGTFTTHGLLMNSGRALHTAISLPDGSVLVAGGINGDSHNGYHDLSSAEVFVISATSSMFTPLSSTMSTPRAGLMAAAYGDGSTILLAFGGLADINDDFPESTSPPGTSATTDSFDSSTMTITPDVPSPSTCPVIPGGPDALGCAISRAAYTATTMANGDILFVGGFEGTAAAFPSADLYNFVQGSFTEIASNMSEPRVFGSSASFASPTGVLVVGGLPFCDGSADLYNPSSNSFTKSSSTLTTAANSSFRCEFFTATTLLNGQVLLVGGLNVKDTVLNTAEIYNPATDTFTATGNMTSPRWGHSAVLLNDGSGDVLIVGGEGCFAGSANSPCPAGNDEFLETAELYNPTAGTFTQITSPLNSFRYFATATDLNQVATGVSDPMVLIAGGSDDNSSLLYDETTQAFSFGGNMNSIRFFQQATPLNDALGLILITGGSGRLAFGAFGSLTAINTAELYVANKGFFCSTGDMRAARAYHAAILGMNGNNQPRVLIAGGVGENTSLGTAELYEPPLEKSPCGPSSGTPAMSGSPADARVAVTRLLSQVSSPSD